MSTYDPTEDVRRDMIAAGVPEQALAAHAKGHAQVWTPEQLKQDFDVTGFMAPYVVVNRKSDGVKGTLMFTHRPRFYFDWSPADG